MKFIWIISNWMRLIDKKRQNTCEIIDNF